MVKKVLNQREIDAILDKNRAAIGNAAEACVEPCNFHNTGQMSDQYVRFMTSLYESYARSVSNSLGAYLRARFEMALASVEQLPVRDFLAGFREAGYVALLNLEPGDSVVVLQVETAIVFPIIDVLLGGFGTPSAIARELTEIDRELMEGVTQILARQLETAWQPLGPKIRLDRQQKAAQIQSVYSATEKLTILTFEARLNETAGAIILSLPANVGSALLREISSDLQGRPSPDSANQPSLRARILECRFDSTVGLSDLKVRLRDLVGLRPGSVLNLRVPVQSPAALILGGREFFEAIPVRSGKQRAAQLLCSSSPPDGSEDGP
jgi:flagellar motor switch protein FliM